MRSTGIATFLACAILFLVVLVPASGASDQAGDMAAVPAVLSDTRTADVLAAPAVVSGHSLVGDEAEIRAELDRMRQIFKETVQDTTIARLAAYRKNSRDPKEVGRLDRHMDKLLRPDPAYLDAAVRDILDKVADRASPDESQYVLYVDRNPAMQVAMVALYDARTRTVFPVGLDLISSGNIQRGEDYYVTPAGVFENLVDNFGYRAEGTPNKDGWRGLGMKGSRVWDFGYTKSLKLYRTGNTMADMRLLIHSTDPVKGERRLGRVNSKGCIRVSHGLNAFLDTYSILDRNYEEWAKTKRTNWLLNRNRSPVRWPGRFLIIGDSSPRPDTPAPKQVTAGRPGPRLN